MTEPAEPTLRGYLDVLRRRLPLVLGVALTVIAVAIAVTLIKGQTYDARAGVAFEDIGTDLGALGAESFAQRSTEQLAAAGARTATTQGVAESVARRLGGERSADWLLDHVDTVVEPGTGVVDILGSGDDEDEAAAVANGFAQVLVALETAQQRARFLRAAGQIQARLARLDRDDGARRPLQEQLARVSSLAALVTPARVVATARPDDADATPNRVFIGVLAAVIGLLLGGLLAFTREAMDRRVQRPDDAEAELGLPVVARVTALGRAPGELDEPDAEAVRVLWRELRARTAARPRTILVTSPQRDEGRSTIAAALAWVARPSVLVEADLRRPVLAERLGLSAAPGTSDVVTQGASLSAALQDAAGFACITAGTPTPDPAGALAAPETAAMLREIDDLVVIDGAPLLAVADARELLDHADAVVLCVRAGGTSRDDARAARRALGGYAGAVVVVLTGD